MDNSIGGGDDNSNGVYMGGDDDDYVGMSVFATGSEADHGDSML